MLIEGFSFKLGMLLQAGSLGHSDCFDYTALRFEPGPGSLEVILKVSRTRQLLTLYYYCFVLSEREAEVGIEVFPIISFHLFV